MARQMKDSGVEWIGEMPENWSLFKLKNIINFQNGFAFDSSKLSNNGKYPVIKIGDICNGSIDIYNANKINDNSGLENYLIKEKDILLAMSGATVGKLGYVSNIDKECYINQRVGIIRTSKSKYVYYYLNTDEFLKYILLLSAGSAQPNISTENINNYYISLPNDIEQQRIADFLAEKVAEIDSAIEKTKATIEDYKKYKQSIITEVVTKGLNPDVEMKDSGVDWIGKIPITWKVNRLKNIFNFGKGLPITKEDLKEKGIAVISYGQIHSKLNAGTEVLPSLIRFVDEKYLKTNNNSLVKENDFIVADTSEDLDGCGNCVYINRKMQLFAGYHTIILKSLNNYDNKYLAYLFKTDIWRSQIRSRVSGIKLFSITQKILKETTVILPKFEEQKEIVSYLDKKCSEIDKLITKKEELIKELENYKKSLIYECVTGKREV